MADDDHEADQPSLPNAASDNPYASPAGDAALPAIEPPSKTSSRRPPHPHIGWGCLWVLGFMIVQVVAGVVILLVPVLLAYARSEGEFGQLLEAAEPSATSTIAIGTFLSVVVALAIAVIMFGRAVRRCLAVRGMSSHQWLLVVLCVLPFGVIASEVTNCVAEVAPQFEAEEIADFASGSWLVVFAAGCLFPAVGEEVFCRGFLGRGFVAWHGRVWGVLLASFLFGAMHIDPVQASGAFALGIGLHIVYLTTRSLLAPILVHMLNNAFAFWIYRNYESFPMPGLSPLPDGTIVHTPWLLLLSAALSTAFLLLLLWQTRTRWLCGDGSAWSPGYTTAEMPDADVKAQPSSALPHPLLLLLTVASYGMLIWALLEATKQ